MLLYAMVALTMLSIWNRLWGHRKSSPGEQQYITSHEEPMDTSGIASGVTLSRLECKEVLRYLNSECDAEVVAKLVAGAGGKPQLQRLETIIGGPSEQQSAKHVLTRVEPPVQQPITDGDPADPVPPPTFFVWEELTEKDRRIYGMTEDGGYDEAVGRTVVASINSEKRATWIAQMKMQRRPHNLNQFDAANADFAPPDRPAHWSIQKVEVGQRNSVGDECIQIIDGFSVCVCSNKHAYVMNNPAVPGCTQCAATGRSASATPEEEVDEDEASGQRDAGAIPGHDSRW